MLDAKITPHVKFILRPVIRLLDRKKVSPDQVTVTGFVFGVIAVPMIIMQWWTLALFCIVLNRIFDGIDGELARYQQSSTSAGGFLDISLDFLFYASIPLAFGLANPQEWGTAALVLLTAFIGTGSSFLAFAAAAEKYQIERPQFSNKSFYYMQGLTEGSETIIFFLLIVVFPESFPWLAYVFALACFITVFTRIIGGFQTLKKVEQHG